MGSRYWSKRSVCRQQCRQGSQAHVYQALLSRRETLHICFVWAGCLLDTFSMKALAPGLAVLDGVPPGFSNVNGCSHVCHALPAGTVLWVRPRHWWPPRWPPGRLLQAGTRRSLPQTWRVETLATIRSTSHSPLPHPPGSQRLPRKRRRRLPRCVQSSSQTRGRLCSKTTSKLAAAKSCCGSDECLSDAFLVQICFGYAV